MSPRLLALPMLCAALTCLAMGCSSRSSDPPGVLDGHLAPCPDRPNCVCSDCEPDQSDRKIAPFAYSGSRQTAMQRLAELLSNMSRVTVITVTEDYLHAEFRSRLFGFVDDVEFYAPEGAQVIQVRSASRVGYWDLGANRKRVERLREAFNALEDAQQ